MDLKGLVPGAKAATAVIEIDAMTLSSPGFAHDVHIPVMVQVRKVGETDRRFHIC